MKQMALAALPPKPAVNTDVPVITSAGGSSAAYKDPNSPESIMRKTTLTQAQSVTDTRFDVPADAFMNYNAQPSLLLIGILLAVVYSLFLVKKRTIRIIILSAVVLVVVLSLTCKKKNGSCSG